MSLTSHLQEIPFFKSFERDEVKQFADLMEEIEFDDKDVIFNEKTKEAALFFILSGKVNIYKMMFGSGQFLTIYDKNDLFGEVAFIDEQVRSASACALGKTKCAKFTHDHFHMIGDKNPKLGMKFLFQLVKELSRKFRAVNEGSDVKSPEQTIYELIASGQLVKITTSETEYMCTVVYVDKNPTNPMLKIDVKGQPILLPMAQVKALTLPNKFGKFG